MRRTSVYIPDLSLTGEILARGYAMSLIGYDDLGVRYEVYMNNDDFIERDNEEADDNGL